MQKIITKTVVLLAVLTLALSVNYIFAAWVGPTEAPPGGNTPTPVHVGTTDQVKDGGLSLEGLSVFGGGYFQGSVGINEVTTSTGGEQDLNLDVEGAIGAKYYCDEDGNNCTSAPFSNNEVVLGAFGDWETRSARTMYQAETDGFVVGWGEGGTGTWSVTLINTTNGNGANIVRQKISSAGGGNQAITGLTIPFNLPVKKGDFYRVSTTNSGSSIYWLPIVESSGSGGSACPADQDLVTIGKSSVCLADGAEASVSCKDVGVIEENKQIVEYPTVSTTAQARYINNEIQTKVNGLGGPYNCDSGWVDGFSASCAGGNYVATAVSGSGGVAVNGKYVLSGSLTVECDATGFWE